MTVEGGSKHILIVDDDVNIRRFLSDSLRLSGYDVENFGDAEAALAHLDTQSFDLALQRLIDSGESRSFCFLREF